MPEGLPAVAAVLLLPFGLAPLRDRPRVLSTLSLSACFLPFAVPLSQPTIRASVALLAWVMFAKALRFAAGHEKPPGYWGFVQFMALPAVIRWESFCGNMAAAGTRGSTTCSTATYSCPRAAGARPRAGPWPRSR